MKQLFFFILLLSACSSRDQLTIGIQPYGNVEKNLIDSVSRVLRREYNADIVLLPVQPIPQHTFVNIKSPRYRADKLIRHLSEVRPDSIDYLLGITSHDISTTKTNALGFTKEPVEKYKDFGIFGLGYMPGSSCVMSTFRTRKTSPKNFVLRMKKISVHEVGHNLGLPHCDSEMCVMRDAVESISTVDNVSQHLCEKCKLKIK
jgi:archaemetzincin